MPTLSNDEIATLHTELANSRYASMTDAQRFDALHGPTLITNPVTVAPQVPKPFSFLDVMGKLEPQSIANVRDLATGQDLIDKINAQDRVGISHWIAALLAGTPLISNDEATAVTSVITATIANPNWTSTVAGPSRKVALFGDKTWTREDGSTVNFVPLEDFAAAR